MKKRAKRLFFCAFLNFLLKKFAFEEQTLFFLIYKLPLCRFCFFNSWIWCYGVLNFLYFKFYLNNFSLKSCCESSCSRTRWQSCCCLCLKAPARAKARCLCLWQDLCRCWNLGPKAKTPIRSLVTLFFLLFNKNFSFKSKSDKSHFDFFSCVHLSFSCEFHFFIWRLFKKWHIKGEKHEQTFKNFGKKQIWSARAFAKRPLRK